MNYTIGEQARLFLTDKYGLLCDMVGRKAELTEEERREVKNMTHLLPCIGDDMIRGLFKRLIQKITD